MQDLKFGFTRKSPPSRCPDCDSPLSEVKRGIELNSQYKVISPTFVDNTSIYRECKCGCVVLWSYPNVWKRRHKLQIFDDKLVVMECP